MHVSLPTPSGPAHVELDRPRGTPLGLLVLTHGSAGGVDARDLGSVRTAALQGGFAVARVTQAFRVAGRVTPPSPSGQDASWLAALAELRRRRGLRTLPLVVGGRSNGARVACRTAGASGAVGVLALAFPLHPPGKPDKSRLPELEAAGVPVLVVQGEKDPFGMPPAGDGRRIVVIPGDGHSLGRDPAAVAGAAMTFVTSLVGRDNLGG